MTIGILIFSFKGEVLIWDIVSTSLILWTIKWILVEELPERELEDKEVQTEFKANGSFIHGG